MATLAVPLGLWITGRDVKRHEIPRSPVPSSWLGDLFRAVLPMVGKYLRDTTQWPDFGS